MAGQDGEGLSTGGLEGTEATRIVAVRSNAILSFDKAETIAARRLRELAIRLRNDDTEAATDRVPFDADRHFRERLAERMAALETDAGATEPAGTRVSYAVSDALSLSALGFSKPLLPAPAVKPTPKADVTQDDGAPAEPSLTTADAENPNVDAHGTAADDDYPVFEPAVRLVDLINQQRTLVTRLADMSLAEDVEADAGPDLTALGSGEVEAATANLAGTADVSPLSGAVEARSDAEELFEAATHPAEPVQHDDAGDEALVPLAISAEQLIAALESGPSSFHEDEPKEKSLAESVLADRAPAEFARRDLTIDTDAEAEGTERAPMIIERARAEMAAIAASEAAPARNSGAVGFFAGLSLSIAAGIVLYYTL